MATGVDGYNFTLIDKKTIEYLQGLKKTVNVAKDYSWNNKLIGAELLQGVLGGESIPKIAGRLRNVEKKMEKSAVKNARTMTTAAQNRGRLDGMAQAQADGVIMQKMWVATHDGRTRDSHAEIDGEQQDQDDAFTNGLMFPADPAGEASEVYNCRCTMISVVKGFFNPQDGNIEEVRTDLEDYTEDAREYWENKEQEEEKEQKEQKEPLKISDAAEAVMSSLRIQGVEYRAVSDYDEIPDFQSIVENISGGDMTGGSCASLALAYAGQKCGYDVLDFRDGSSRNWFGGKLNKVQMFRAIGANIITEDDAKSSVTNGKKILSRLELDKEYYLSVGRHAAIVRKVERDIIDFDTLEVKGKKTVYQYLELQAPRGNGWKNFDEDVRNTLQYRFGCSTSGRFYPTAYATEISQLKGDDFKAFLGYLNTEKDKQRKGGSGFAK